MAVQSRSLADLEAACGNVHDYYASAMTSSNLTYSGARIARSTIKFSNDGSSMFFVLAPRNLTFGPYYQYLPARVSLTTPWDISTIDVSTLYVSRPGQNQPFDAYGLTDRTYGAFIFSPNYLAGNTAALNIPGGYADYWLAPTFERSSGANISMMGAAPIRNDGALVNQFNSTSGGYVLDSDEYSSLYSTGASNSISGNTFSVYDAFYAPIRSQTTSSTEKHRAFFTLTMTNNYSTVYLVETSTSNTDANWWTNNLAVERYITLGTVSDRPTHFAFNGDGSKLYTNNEIRNCTRAFSMYSSQPDSSSSFGGTSGIPDKIQNNYDQGFFVHPNDEAIYFIENTDYANNSSTLYAYEKDPFFDTGSGTTTPVSNVVPPSSDFGFKVFDDTGFLRFDSTAVTWNQVAFYRVNAGVTDTQDFPQVAGKLLAIGQIMIDPPIFTAKAIDKNVSVSGTQVTVTGGTVDVYILVLVKG